MLTEEELNSIINDAIVAITLEHSKILATNLLVYYKAGADSVRKTKLSPLQYAAIDKLTKEHFGYLAEFNQAVGNQIRDKAKTILANNGGYDAIKKELIPYIEDIAIGKEQVIIDNRGKMRTVIGMDKEGKLYKTEVEITHVYKTNINAYAETLSRTSIHTAWEDGRHDEYRRMGFKRWRFLGPLDERARPWHSQCVGNIYEYGTEQSSLAEMLLREPNCRHRSIPIYDDPALDTPQEVYDKLKIKAGLHWNDTASQWAFAEA